MAERVLTANVRAPDTR